LQWSKTKSIVVKLAEIMQIMGGGITSMERKCGSLFFWQITKDGFKPQHGILLLQIFQAMLKEHSPTIFFELNGKYFNEFSILNLNLFRRTTKYLC
jgi:hypothetical protein